MSGMAALTWSTRARCRSDTFSALMDSAWSSLDRKSTRLNSSHLVISYAVFCLKKKKKHISYIYTIHINTTSHAPHTILIHLPHESSSLMHSVCDFMPDFHNIF